MENFLEKREALKTIPDRWLDEPSFDQFLTQAPFTDLGGKQWINFLRKIISTLAAEVLFKHFEQMSDFSQSDSKCKNEKKINNNS